MRPLYLILLFCLLCGGTSAQNKGTWFAFWNKDHSLTGFKDKTGKIRVSPRFNTFTIAGRFDDIIGAARQNGDHIDTYYLTKSGKIVGKGDLYIFDNGADCESEGYIRFRDKLTHKVGMFNARGDIAIPAEYDNLSPVRNGMIMAMRDGRWDASLLSEHNQFPWVGSKQLLIDINNKVIIEPFPYNEEINFFSVLVSKQPDKNPTRLNFRSTEGKYYSFLNFDKEFIAWLRDSLLKDLSKIKLLRASYKNIVIWNKQKGWINESKHRFIDNNFNLLHLKLLGLNSSNSNYAISTEGLNSYIYTSKEFEKYFDNCGASKNWIYPVKNVVINNKIDNNIVQDQLGFLKTDHGYKLIEVSVNVGNIR